MFLLEGVSGAFFRPLAVLGIALVLYLDFQSGWLVAFTLGTLPFARVGGVAGVLLTGGVVSLGSAARPLPVPALREETAASGAYSWILKPPMSVRGALGRAP
ncbi:hypothetical protein [Corallococcus carmarthensis]|uniref:Uncharacterized protein n=1 Tax=Corallococcus carmarthensis TaxID=2316728 RepID=A0A3A8KA59_9BACT|nr:hypothetical protein [Corallococcus carmarthensis]NOK16510.1 hypothetical protein [Corallococcus carmarthensis]RKH04109.1 hypothetical protein D7X32_11880 [Corallococcus carmarthensis]